MRKFNEEQINFLSQFVSKETLDEIVAASNPEKVTKPSNYQVHRFSAEQVAEIRNLRQAGSKLKEIANKFDCSTVLISNICRGKLYRFENEIESEVETES